MSTSLRNQATSLAINRLERRIDIPRNEDGKRKKVSEYYAESVFDIRKASSIPEKIRNELQEISLSNKPLLKEHADLVSRAVTEWAISKGATHFCHWFHPLTGSTAEKHDAFLSFAEDNTPIEELSASQLIKGEPDASSFPNGGSRSTFEARGYTTWDLSSPMFLVDGINGKTLCIPTAFACFYGGALDTKIPLLRSISRLSDEATRFMKLTGSKKTKRVIINCGAEQEYFLIDKAFYYARPDLVMTGRTLIGSLTAKNQQLSDHYFGTIPERVLSFMQELDLELHRQGIPAKTRHNEVAPGQFEIAPIYTDANLAADHNQLTMALIKKVANRHDFVALLHERPFAGINGSGKHLNWSMCDDSGINLLGPGEKPEQNRRFLAMISVIVQAVYRHGDALRMVISGHGNDHRLGGHEAPPSILSVFLGKTLSEILKSVERGESFVSADEQLFDLGAKQLAGFFKDYSDRNRTSPFAFTGNRFEFRAVGSSQPIGFPLSVLNAAVVEVLREANDFLEEELKNGKKVEESLANLICKLMSDGKNIVFNGDGYSDSWVREASERGLPNLKNTYEALSVLDDGKASSFLVETGVMKKQELNIRYNVLMENYVKHLKIETDTLVSMVNIFIIPAVIDYKLKLSEAIGRQKETGFETDLEKNLYEKLGTVADMLCGNMKKLSNEIKLIDFSDDNKAAKKMVEDVLPLIKTISSGCNKLENIIPDSLWPLPKYFEMLFLR